MKKDLTELVFILDMSGSMAGLTEDTIGGFNSMIEKQKNEDGECLVSVVLFNNDSQVLFDRVPVADIPEMTRREYNPGGCTALIDAMGGAIHHIGNVHKYAREEDVPEKTIFVITTDGLENASRFYSADKVRSMVKHEQDEYGWEFLFLGANIDAVETARTYGLREGHAVRYRHDREGVKLNYKVMEDTIAYVRSEKRLPEDWMEKIREDYEGRDNK